MDEQQIATPDDEPIIMPCDACRTVAPLEPLDPDEWEGPGEFEHLGCVVFFLCSRCFSDLINAGMRGRTWKLIQKQGK